MTESPKKQNTLLVCDDDQLQHLHLKRILGGHFECRFTSDTDEAVQVIKNHSIDALLLDIRMRTPTEGLDILPKLVETDPDLAIVMFSSYGDFQLARDAMRLGAADYVIKTVEKQELIHTLNQAISRRALLRRSQQQTFEVQSTHRQNAILGESPMMIDLRRTIERARNSSANVVIYGETGTGKELVARLLRSKMPDGSLGPFVAVDSATIQSSMAESILFGHEKGAFTGADRTSKGIFEEACGGIVYFDEIANMPLQIQAKLLRVLQEKEITRVGSTKVIQLQFRAICATNKDLDKMATSGEFKDDLLQRLNVIPIRVPTLRERIEDLPLLAQHFSAKHFGNPAAVQFSERAMKLLSSYSWPGNVRELGNLIEYLGTMQERPWIDAEDLPPKIWRGSQSLDPEINCGTRETSFYKRVADFEASLLKQELSKNTGSMTDLAQSLGMNRSHLYAKLKTYDIHV